MGQVTIKQLEKIYPASRKTPAFRAVKGIDLRIADGEFMVLVGPSGCGKSTTLRMIAGLEQITRGEIAIDERVINDLEPKDRGIAMVFQNYALYPHMTVAENMGFALKLAKTPKPEIKRRVGEAARILGLEELLDRRPAALSGGQRQRVAVGRAIVRQPKVFLFDEPLSNLDAKMRVQMRSELARLHQRLGTTMVYVTHDQIEAMTMGDRICVMKDGEIMQVADPLTLYHQPANTFVAGFIGTPPMNLLAGRIQSRGGTPHFVEGGATAAAGGVVFPLGGRLADLAGRLPAGATDGAVTFGIRPENIADASNGSAKVPGGAALTLPIDLAEPMGAETYVHLRTGTGTMIARLHTDRRFADGAQLPVTLDLEKAHFFDAKTGRVLS